MLKVLFVCIYNSERSQMAEEIKEAVLAFIEMIDIKTKRIQQRCVFNLETIQLF